MSKADEPSVADIDALIVDFCREQGSVTPDTAMPAEEASTACWRLWIEACRNRDEEAETPLRVLLPRFPNGDLLWYVVSTQDEDVVDLREQLTAFAGPSYSDFRGQLHELDPDDPPEAAILEHLGSDARAFRIRPEQTRDGRRELAEVLSLLHRIASQSDRRQQRMYRPLASVLHDFNMATAAGERAAAERAIAELRERRLLDAVNLQFLNVQLLWRFQQWDDLLREVRRGDLLKVRKPLRVVEAIAQAIYHCHLREAAATLDFDELRRAYAEEVRPEYGQLVFSARDARTPEGLLYLMVDAATSEPPRFSVCEQISQHAVDDDTIAECIELIAETVPRAHEPAAPADRALTPVEVATAAFARGDYQLGAELAGRIEDDLTRARLLLECATELSSNASQRAAAECIQGLSEAEREALFSSRVHRTLWEMLRGGFGDAPADDVCTAVASGWCEWLPLLHTTDFSDRRLLEIAVEGAHEWTVDNELDTPEHVEQFLGLLDNASKDDIARPRLTSALPSVVSFLLDDAFCPRAELAQVYSRLREILTYCSSGVSVSALAVFGDLANISLGIGLDDRDYCALVDEMEYMLEESDSPACLAQALDVFDLLIFYPCPSSCREARQALGRRLLTQGVSWRQQGRVESGAWDLACHLARDIGEEEWFKQSLGPEARAEVASEADLDPLSRLTGIVGIYSLMESAAARAAKMILDRNPDLQVKVNHDTDGTEILRALSVAVDVLVVVTWSAKHAATDYIRTHRGQRPIVFPDGRGSTSIVRSLEGYAQGLDG